jgi:hypothetical protein
MRWISLLLLLLPALAFAQQDYPRAITLSWTNPDTYEFGTPIEPGDLESIRVECFRQSDPLTPVFTSTVPDTGEGLAQSETFDSVIPSPGTYSCFAYAIVVGGAESAPSNEAIKKYTGKPLPPQTFN